MIICHIQKMCKNIYHQVKHLDYSNYGPQYNKILKLERILDFQIFD